MAQATETRTGKMIEVVVTKRVEERTITLTLTDKEAVVIRTLCRRAGGCPEHSPRKYADRVEAALAPLVHSITDAFTDLSGSMFFYENKHFTQGD